MPAEKSPGKPTTRRYTDTEKAQAVRLVRELRKELGTEHVTVYRVANQLGYGVESVRAWVRQANVDDGVKPGISSEEAVPTKGSHSDRIPPSFRTLKLAFPGRDRGTTQ